MAESSATGRVEPDISRPGFFNFTLDGLASARQMERLIRISADMADRVTKGKSTAAKAEKDNTAATEANTTAKKDEEKVTKSTVTAKEKLNDAFQELERVATGSVKGLSGLNYFLNDNKALTLGLTAFGTTLGALNAYADNLGKAMQIGVAGDVMSFATGAKLAGLKLESFTKALVESGGAFASLGSNATDGALRFGNLVEQIRKDTYSVGNLGLSMDELATFTAQQLKVAVGQGFKGKQAQEQVRQNAIALSKDLADLSTRTGKSVTELAAAANKLATDPLISAMVSTSRQSKEDVSKAVASFGANLRGLFGEAGDKLAGDALKSAAAGLPFAMTETGKQLIIASQPLYNEIDKLAKGVAQGREVTSEDRVRLAEVAKREVQMKGQQLKTLSMIEGPAGEAARQVLALAQQAEFYNTAQGKEQLRQQDAARKFVAERNRLEANLQQAMLPLIEMLNNVNWNAFYEVLNGAAIGMKAVYTAVFAPIASLLSKTGAGTLLGGLIALGGVLAAVIAVGKTIGVVAGAGKAILSGGISGMFSGKHDGSNPTKAIWVRDASSGLGGLLDGKTRRGRSPWDLANMGTRGERARRVAGGRMAQGMSSPLAMAGGALFAGGALSAIGGNLGGDAGAVMDLLGTGLDIASVMMLYKTYGAKGAVQIGKLAQRAGIVKGKGLKGVMGGIRLGSTVVRGGVGAVAGGMAADAVVGDAKTGAGTAGNIAGSIAGGLGGMALGRVLGGVLGAWGGPIGIAIGSAAGGIIGQVIGDKFGDDITNTAISANEQVALGVAKQGDVAKDLNEKVAELIDYQRAANQINAQGVNYQRDTSRNIKYAMPSN